MAAGPRERLGLIATGTALALLSQNNSSTPLLMVLLASLPQAWRHLRQERQTLGPPPSAWAIEGGYFGTEGAVSRKAPSPAWREPVFSLIGCSLSLVGWELLLPISLIAWLATLVESVIGGELQPSCLGSTADPVNALMTAIAAAAAFAMGAVALNCCALPADATAAGADSRGVAPNPVDVPIGAD